MPDSLERTGERPVTSRRRPRVYEHLHRYAIASSLAAGKRVLDVACGDGSGAKLLARAASSVTALAADGKAVDDARANHRHRGLEFIEGSCTEIPCGDGTFDLVVSFQAVQTTADRSRFLSELKRVLSPGGVVVIATAPHAEGARDGRAANGLHESGLSHADFVRAVKSSFKHCLPARQRLVVGSWIAADLASEKVSAATFSGDFEAIDVERGVHGEVCSLAICSDRPLPPVNLGVFDDLQVTADTLNLVDTAESPAQLRAQLAEANELRRVAEERATELAGLRSALDEQSNALSAAREACEQKEKRVRLLESEVQDAQRQLGAARAIVEEKTRELASLQSEVAENAALKEQTAHEKREAEAWKQALSASSRAADHFRSEAAHQTQLVENLMLQLQVADDRLARISHELLEARWEALTARGNSVRDDGQPAESSLVLDLQNRTAAAEAECENLRNMLKAVQSDVEQHRIAREAKEAELRSTKKDLRFQQKQMGRLKEVISRKFVLPFGKAQRRIEQLTSATRSDVERAKRLQG